MMMTFIAFLIAMTPTMLLICFDNYDNDDDDDANDDDYDVHQMIFRFI